MIYIAQIVELDRCMNNASAWLQFDRHGTEVTLLKEDSNIVAPDQAVAAYIDGQKVGYVASANLPAVRAILGAKECMNVRYEHSNTDHSCFYVSLVVEKTFVEPAYQERLAVVTIGELPLPQLNPSHFLIANGVERVCHAIQDTIRHHRLWSVDDFEQMLTYTERLQEQYGTSLSGDHFRAVVNLLATIQMMKDYLGESVPLLTDFYPSLYTTLHSFATTEMQCLKIWKKELAQAQKIIDSPNGFWSQLKLSLQGGKLTQAALIAQTRRWLEQLPHDLWLLWQKNPNLFALRLYHERFSTQELDIIKTHLVIYKHAQEWQDVEERKTDWGNILFNETVQNYERANVVRAMHKFNASHTGVGYVDKLREHVQSYVARNILRSPLDGNFTQYCRALKEYFGCQFDTENFRKTYKGKKMHR